MSSNPFDPDYTPPAGPDQEAPSTSVDGDTPRLVRVAANQHVRKEFYSDQPRPDGPLLRRETPRPRKDRYIAVGPNADSSQVERTSALASAKALNLSAQDRYDRSREGQLAKDESLLDAVLAKGGLPALTALAEMRDRLPAE